MKKYIPLFLFLLLSVKAFAQNNWPIVIENTNNGYPQAQFVRTSPSTGVGYYGLLKVNNDLVASTVLSNQGLATAPNGTSTTYWYKVDLPGPNSAVVGYMAAGSEFADPNCSSQYFTIAHPSIYVRSSAQIGPNNYITYSGDPGYPVYVFSGQNYPLIGSIYDPTDNITFYEIDLPDGYSSTVGYVAAIVSGVDWTTIPTNAPPQSLPTPTLSASNVTANSVDLSWIMNYQPSGTVNTSFLISNNTTGQNYTKTSAQNSSNTYTVTGLSPNTSYTFSVQANFMSCSSANSNQVTITTTGPSCSYSISPTSNVSIPSSGGTYNINVTAGPTCNWTATPNDSWISVTSGSGGQGSGVCNYTVAPNNGTSPLNGTITIAGQTFSITEAGNNSVNPPNASFTLSPTSVSQGGTITATSTSTGNPTSYSWTCGGCTGVSFSNPSAAITSITFANTGTYNINLQVGNSGGYSQTGQQVSVTSASNNCTYSITPSNNYNAPSGGESGGISVTTQSGCSWNANASDPWITITSGSSGQGSGSCQYTLAPNTGSSQLTGSITIAGQTFNITQAGTGQGSPGISITRVPLNFGSVGVNSSKQMVYTITNSGTAPLTVNSINYPPGFSGDWENSTIPPGNGVDVTVTFTPTAATTYGGTVTINSNATPGVNTFSCSGTGTQTGTVPTAQFTVSPNTVVQGGTATTTNNSTGNPTSYLWWSSANSGITFSPNGTATSTAVAPVITFTKTGTWTIYLQALNAASSNEAQQNVTVTAPASGSAISLSGNLSFGSVTVGSTSTKTLTIKNTGTSNLTISNISYPAGFTGSPNSGVIVPGASQQVTVSFAPASVTNYGGNITVSSDASNRTNVIACSGAGVQATQPTISITSSVIPPWQRARDPFKGLITADLSNAGANPMWHIEADVFDQNGNYIKAINIGEGSTSSTINFSSSDVQQYDIPGYHFNWNAVLESDNKHVTDPQQTDIIDSMWKDRNVVFYNKQDQELKIPIEYFSDEPNVTINFTRDNSTSQNFLGKDLSSSDNIIQASVNIAGGQRYFLLNYSTSNIKDVTPGQFTYTITYQGEGVQNSGRIDLIKIGRINQANSNKIVVFIAGLWDDIEHYIPDLQNDPSASDIKSKLDFSLAAYIGRTNYFNTWYVAMGNTNSVKENAYNIGIALEKIRQLNVPNFTGNDDEIDIVGHSAAGLDIRALLGNSPSTLNLRTQSLDGSSFDFNDSLNLVSKVKKVVFLDVPHRGVLVADVAQKLQNSIILNASPLMHDLNAADNLPTHILNVLKNTPMPQSIVFANLTGEYNEWPSDGIVGVWSSEYPYLGNSREVIQMYQTPFSLLSGEGTANAIENGFNATGWKNIDPLNILHVHIHQNHTLFLDADDAYNCTTSQSNLEKIYNFLLDQNPENEIESCFHASLYTSYSGFVSGSLLPGALISVKRVNDSLFQPVSVSDENGFFNFSMLDKFSDYDSLKIEAPGYNRIETIINNTSFNYQKIGIPMIKSNLSSKNVEMPELSLINQSPITNADFMLFKTSGKNVLKYEINKPFNQDSIFVPLNVSNNQFKINLDTGENLVEVKFIGETDTTLLSKSVYYLPDNLLGAWTDKVTIIVPKTLLGAKLFVNNQYYQDISTTNTNLNILTGHDEIRISRYGYLDTVYDINSDSTIQLSMVPYSYSSLTDSSTINFGDGLNPQYWKNITVQHVDSSSGVQISLKQYDDPFTNMGLVPKTRKFVLHNLSSQPVRLRAAMALDQANTPDSANVYLMSINDGVYTKLQANIPNLTEYDPEVQKIEYDSIQLNGNGTEQLLLMKKLAPIFLSQDLNFTTGQQMDIPISDFVENPDSIPNDVNLTVAIDGNPVPGFDISVSDGIVHVRSTFGFTGDVHVNFTATHDFITANKDFTFKIAPPPLNSDQLYLFPNPASDKITIMFTLGEDYAHNTITIYDVLGRPLIHVLNNVALQKGFYTYTVPLGDLQAGAYFVNWSDKQKQEFIKR